ncbi:integrin alpha-6 [Amia ocellicauda]|uniref:integrin alpha-6 n=1 Tax=Amia ocellicauda TaxID=2972642 RepID=UPI003463A048
MAFATKWLFLQGGLICLLQWTSISAFNLDTQNVFRKNGERGSLFGFSLAMHRQLQPTDKRLLLVGAPRAKALKHQKANITGGLYSCEFTTQSNDCKRIDFDNEADPNDESKENQWMGVTVQSQGPGGKIVTCAHRYQKRRFVNTPQESRDITGRCYVLSQNLQIDTNADEDGGSWKFCEGRERGHERFGSCQQGLSATFTKDFHYIVFGAPGAYNWKGIVRAEQKNSTLLELGVFDDGPYEVGDENRFDQDLVPVPANSYLGFSLDSGKSITKKDHLTIVSGAPRANHSGAVVLLQKEGQHSRMLSPQYILEGEGLASSFGYDVAVVDLNGDGWQDIVVGAPQFFVKDGEIGGAVYVYINNEGKWDKVKPIRLNGTKDSMFGLAVENIGDVNQDGYQDIAVGAPYDDNGSGKVFIYHGSKNGIITKPTQTLSGKDNNIQLFGYSLAGNMDLDSNSYPDIAIGSLSDAVLLYRSKPVISINKAIEITPKEIDLTKKNCGDSICMDIKACFYYTANPKDYSPKLTVAYTFEAEEDRRKLKLLSRVFFTDRNADDPDYRSTGTLELKGQNQRQCVSKKIKLTENIKDKLRSIPISVSVAIKKARRRKRQANLPELVPVLNSNEPVKAVSEVNFVKEGCGSDNICQSKLNISYRFCYKESNQDVFPPLPIVNGLPEISLSDQKDIALEITVTNANGDDAHEARLVATFPDTLSYSASRTLSEKDGLCHANQNGSRAECDLGNPFKRDSKIIFVLILSTAGISLDTKELEIDLKLETTSEQKSLAPVKAKANVVIELLLSVSGVAKPSQLYFGGQVKGESAMVSEDDVGNLIEFEFRVINLGKPLKSFDNATLNIQWPKENHQGKWLLYLVKVHGSGLEKVSCTPREEINNRKLKASTSISRTKREADAAKSSQDGKVSLLTDQRKYKTLTCGEGAKCVTMRCPLQGLDSNAIITLRSRLWNSTFLESYSNLNYLDILVKASLSLDVSARNMVLKNAESQVRLTVFPEKAQAQYSGAPWWIILIAVLLGILMLGLLVFLLWKCGFFKRAKKDHYDAAYHKAEIHVQPSDKERLTTDA